MKIIAAPQPAILGRMKAAGLGLVGAFLVSCTASPPQPPAYDPRNWSAAIGLLNDDRDQVSCSATLVAADVIATAAHCVLMDGRALAPQEFTFHPNLDAASLSSSKGIKVIAIGVDPDRSMTLDVSADWALMRIAPPITTAAPMVVGRFSIADIDEVLATGGYLLQAGYGVYDQSAADQRLYQQGHCRRLTDASIPEKRQDYLLQTSCRPAKGDSGGPVILVNANDEHYLIGVISSWPGSDVSKDRFTMAAGSLGFASHLTGVR